MTRSDALVRAPDDARLRPPAVAGTFYPAAPDDLAAELDRHLAAAEAALDAGAATGPRPKAIIVPHAGYRYSGPVAAAAFARLLPWRHQITRVVLLGPAHRVPVRGLALSSADRWVTPLGEVPLDTDARDRLAARPDVVVDDRAHAPEHALEVEVPFLQRVLGPFTLLPVVVGGAGDEDTAAVLDAEWGGDETLVVISTDLSHYHDQPTAQARDRRTAEHVVAGRPDDIGTGDACGAHPLRGLLTTARRRGLAIDLVDLRTSADTAGSPDRVVGYGAFVVTEPDAEVTEPDIAVPHPGHVDETTAEALLSLADDAIRAQFEDRPPIRPHRPDTGSAGDDDPLDRPGATFVTLRDGDRLIGCIGSLEPRRSLADDVAGNAVAAAFRDPRLPALTAEELPRVSIHISVLSPTEELAVSSFDELRAALVPGEDGVVVESGRHRATFLPAVWEQLPGVDEFLDHLWDKARLRRRSWPRETRAWRYRVTEIADDGPRPPLTGMSET